MRGGIRVASTRLAADPALPAEQVVARLALWAETVPDGLAQVAYFAETRRDRAVALLTDRLITDGVPVHVLPVPMVADASAMLRALLLSLEGAGAGVISVVWSQDTFPSDAAMREALGAINFYREVIARLPLRQIWWMPHQMSRMMADATPDIDSWFLTHLTLADGAEPRTTQESRVDRTAAGYVFMVPLARNPFFEGREAEITTLHQALHAGKSALISQAISGLGGVGKTQMAAEYAYRFRSEYKCVLWTPADSVVAIETGYRDIARALQLPERDAGEADAVSRAVRRWLADNTGYLLVFDNADHPEVVKPFLPEKAGGHILLTSRSRQFAALGDIATLRLPVLDHAAAADFLLRRIYRGEASASERTAIEDLVQELDGLPLALELAASFIVETGTGVGRYLQQFRKNREVLLRRTGPVRSDYRETVLTTWKPNFDAIAGEYPASAELLRISAFLAPDAIPFELFNETGASPEALLPLERYSLVTVETEERTFSLHRLVQEVIKAGMSAEQQRDFVRKAIDVVAAAWPGQDFAHWSQLDRLLPHQLACAERIAQYRIETEAAASLLTHAALYLDDRAQYREAGPLYRRSLEIRDAVYPRDRPERTISLSNLGLYHLRQGDYKSATPLLEQALAINEQSFGQENPIVATCLNNLAQLLQATNCLSEAELLTRRALAIDEQSLGSEHPDVARDLNNLAQLLQATNCLPEAELLMRRALAIDEQSYGPQHPDVAVDLNNLALLLQATTRLSEAEPLMRRALAIGEHSLGPEHPDVAIRLGNLAHLLQATKRLSEAEPLVRRALAIREQSLGPDHPSTITARDNLAAMQAAAKA
jgi:tetratricopeptide (TPR) repeat protein